jgi:excisionase family DNA binding protein
MENEIIWLSTEQACEKLGISMATLYRYLGFKENRLPSYKIGGVLRIRADELNKWVESHKTN